MKDKPSEWIAISDLMAGVMAVVMLLLVVSVLQKSAEEAKHKQELEQLAQATDPRQQRMGRLMGDLQESLSHTANDGMVSLDVNARRITLKDGVFSRGSACVTDQSKAAFASIQTKLTAFLGDFRDGRIYVEGHTDDRPVSRPVTDFTQFCTVYDDNYTLSAARAREARKLLTAGLDEAASRRVVVAGFGDSQPLAGIAPEDSRQRRIEVRLVIPDGTQ